MGGSGASRSVERRCRGLEVSRLEAPRPSASRVVPRRGPASSGGLTRCWTRYPPQQARSSLWRRAVEERLVEVEDDRVELVDRIDAGAGTKQEVHDTEVPAARQAVEERKRCEVPEHEVSER